MSARADFASVSEEIIATSMAFDPVRATFIGVHDHDDRLPDFTPAAVDDHIRRLDTLVARLDGIDDVALSPTDGVDLEVLRARVAASVFDLKDIARFRWDPLTWDPASGLHALAIRDFAPAQERRLSAERRLDDLPRFLADARVTLGEMSAIHVETAIDRLEGFDAVLDGLHPLGPLDAASVDAARDAVDQHGRWLTDQLPHARRDPRLGVRLYSAALWHHLDEEVAPVQVLEWAEAHLDVVNARMREVAAEYLDDSVRSPDVVRRALADMADRAAVVPTMVLPTVAQALERTTAFVRDRDLVSLVGEPIEIVPMPRIHHGVAPAYCDAPGALESAALESGGLPTFVAVAPPPAEWSEDRIRSFLREYNTDLLHDLTIHEAMPGHVVQLAHARRVPTSRVRRMTSSGVFVEGWAVYAEEMMVERGYRPDDEPRAHLRIHLQQLKMQARMTLNAILDARVHGGDIDEPEAISLLRRRGFQEEQEAVGKWRRALLTAVQLPTYFVGWRGVRSLIDDVRFLHPDWSDRQVHDLILSEGSLGPRHLRALLGL